MMLDVHGQAPAKLPKLSGLQSPLQVGDSANDCRIDAACKQYTEAIRLQSLEGLCLTCAGGISLDSVV